MAGVTIAAGETESYTLTGVITGEVTNTATATGSFGDPDTTEAVTTDPVTVTSQPPHITVTKVPAASAVCDGRSVTYTYTVTNNSDRFAWTGDLTDDKLGLVARRPHGRRRCHRDVHRGWGHHGQRRQHRHRRGVLDDPDARGQCESAARSPARLHHHGDQDRRQRRRVRRRVGDLHLCGHEQQRQFDWTGTLSDIILGVVGRGHHRRRRHRELHPHGIITGEVTNTATATGSFGDPTPPRPSPPTR